MKRLIISSTKKGDCYHNAWWRIMDNPDENYTLVHAVINSGGPPGSEKFGHGFIIDEDRYEVIDETFQGDVKTYPVELYWYLNKIRTYVEYTREDAENLASKYHHSGPWDPKISAYQEDYQEYMDIDDEDEDEDEDEFYTESDDNDDEDEDEDGFFGDDGEWYTYAEDDGDSWNN